MEGSAGIGYTNATARAHGIFITPRPPRRPEIGLPLAVIAAALVFVLFFVETLITQVLLVRPERGLSKGNGPNWDLILCGLCALICSVLGLPWMCPAAVQSLAHASSLAVPEKKKGGGSKSSIAYVVEQRLTIALTSLAIGAFVPIGHFFHIPMASLFGVFLYLGVMNLRGVQMVKRFTLIYVPVKHHPTKAYTKKVSTLRMHVYTSIQIALVVIIYAVKSFPPTALTFPCVLVLFVVFRQLVLPRVYTADELDALDGDHEPHVTGYDDDDESSAATEGTVTKLDCGCLSCHKASMSATSAAGDD